MDITKAKKKNWSDMETEVLLTEIASSYSVLLSKLQTAITVAKKKKIWTAICTRVNSVGGLNRDIESCKKRWRDLKAAFLAKKTEAAKTGGGKPVPPMQFEDLVGQILGENTALKSGVTGGLDTFSLEQQECSEDNHSVTIILEEPEGDDCTPEQNTPSPTEGLYITQDDWTVHNVSSTIGSSEGTQIVDLEAIPSTSYFWPVSQAPSSSLPMCSSTPSRLTTSSWHTHSRSRSPPELQPPTKKRSFIKSMTEASERRKDESELTIQWLQSEIQKNQSQIEKNESDMERNKSVIDRNKAETDKIVASCKSQTEISDLTKKKLELQIEKLKYEIEQQKK